MKIAILAAGGSDYFPLFIDKPKCMYHLNGEIQLERVIKDAKCFAEDKDIIVVAGYKYEYIENFLERNYPLIKCKINEKFNQQAIYSLRKAIENDEDDFVFMLADESIRRKNVERICSSNRKMALLCHDDYYYYSVGIIKLRKDQLYLLKDDKYLSMDAMKEIYCFANNKTEYDGSFNINSGICLGYMTIDFVRRIGGIDKITNPVLTYHGEDIDFIHYDPKSEYIKDLDSVEQTDEYKNSFLLRLYNKYVSKLIRKIIKVARRII